MNVIFGNEQESNRDASLIAIYREANANIKDLIKEYNLAVNNYSVIQNLLERANNVQNNLLKACQLIDELKEAYYTLDGEEAEYKKVKKSWDNQESCVSCFSGCQTAETDLGLTETFGCNGCIGEYE